MRPSTLFTAFALLFTAAAAAPQQQDTSAACFSELECSGYDLSAPTPVAAPVERALTNAQRLSRGLPLARPRHISPSRVRRQAPSSTPTVRGYIRVDRADGTGSLGFVSKSSFSLAQYRYQTMDTALIVNFAAGSTAVSQIEITTENGDIMPSYPLLSMVEGRDNTSPDFATGSFQYAYLAGSEHTAPGSPAQPVDNSYTHATGTSRSAESSVWSYNPATQQLSPQWINSDGSAPATTVFTQSTAIYLGGDAGAFVARYPSPVIVVNLYFVPL